MRAHDGDSCTIRPATIDDLTAVSRVHVATWQAAYRGIVPDSFLDRLSVEENEARFRRLLFPDRVEGGLRSAMSTSTGVFMNVAECDGQIVGHAMCGQARRSIAPFTGELYAIYILPSHHGRGIGGQLVAASANQLQQRGMDSMYVWVLHENPAVHFYQKLGAVYVQSDTLRLDDTPIVEDCYGWHDTRSL